MGGAPGGAASAAPDTNEKRQILDDFEGEPALGPNWSVTGGPGAAALLVQEVVHTGRCSLRFKIQVDHSTGPDPEKFPGGWRHLRRNFSPAADWSNYEALEFYIYVPPTQPPGPLKYGIHCADDTREPVWSAVVSPETLVPGEWTRVTLALTGVNVRGNLKKVTQIHFYIAEHEFKDKAELNFYFDDFALLAKSAEAVLPEKVRKAGNPLAIPETYRKEAEPVVYPVVPLEFIYPDTDLSSRPRVDSLTLRAARGEIKPLTFAVLAGDVDIFDLALDVSDFEQVQGTGRLKGSIADPRVVKVWEQAALHWEVFGPEDKILVPELLVKDDRIPFRDEYNRETLKYTPPSVLSFPFGTDIPAHTLKQVWISFSVPEGADPGLYKGVLTLTAKSGLKVRKIPISLEVLPFVLPPPKLHYGVMYRQRLIAKNPKGRDMEVSRDAMLKDFLELKRAGLDSVEISDASCNAVPMLELMREAGMRGPAIVFLGYEKPPAEDVKGILEAAANAGIGVYFYGRDEPNDPARLADHKELSAYYHSLGGRVVVCLTVDTARRLVAENECPDWAILPMERGSYAGPYIDDLRAGKAPRLAPFMSYYWQVYEENPTRNRLYTGFYLWQSGLDGALPYEYRGHLGSPYADDRRNSDYGGRPRVFRQWCLTYPSQEGPVSTLQWEGYRAGVTDVRYLTYLEELLGQAEKAQKGTLVSETREKMNDILKPFATLPQDATVHTNPFADPEQMEKARERIVDLILTLKSKL